MAAAPQFPPPEPDDGFDRVAGGFAGPDPSDAPSSLFRQEAIDAAANTGFGKAVAMYPVPWRAMSIVLLILVILFVALLVNGNYSRKETVTGIVRTVGGEVRVAASAPGVVTTLNVAEGQKVRAGETILTVTTARTGVDGRPFDAVALDSIESEITNLESRLGALDAAEAIQQRGRISRLGALRSERSSAVAVENAGRQRLALAEKSVAKIEPVAAKGFVSGEQMRRRYEEIILLRQGIEEALGRQAALDGSIGDFESARDQGPLTLLQEKGRLLDLIARARRERETYMGQRGYIVKAAASGVVTALQIAKGQMVDPQRTLMTIAAPGAIATAEVYVPSRAIGFLEPGQRVRVRYDAIPFQRFGAAEGIVKSISASVLRPEEVQAAVDVKEPMYRVLVTLERNTMQAYGKSYPIQPGFALTADIVLEDRSFASWLFDPLRALTGRL
jgi:membrane fusion protein